MLTLKNLSTNETVTRQSDAAGVFNFNALPANMTDFTLMVSSPGFKNKVLSNLHLIPEQPNALNVQLELGDVTESVTVNASETAAIDRQTANLGGTISANQVQHMPSFNRDVFMLSQLIPGLQNDGSQASGGGGFQTPGNQTNANPSNSSQVPTENGPAVNSSGQHIENNSISIDGISTVSAAWGGGTVITPTEESIDNVRILTNNYDAEFGRFSGAQTLITSKSGTNSFHGSLFFALHRPGLNAYQRYNTSASVNTGTPAARGLLRDEQRFNQYGGSVGGPIWRDRIFAFFAYEAIRNSTNSTATGWYDTAAYDALAPSGSIASTFLNFPGSRPSNAVFAERTCQSIGLTEGVNCREITGQGLNIGSPLTTGRGTQDLTYQSSTNPGVGSGLTNVADIAFYTTASPTKYDYTQYNGRLDANVSGSDHVSFAIYWVPQSTSSYNGPQRPYNLFHHDQTNDAFSIIWNHTFSPSFLNEARANAAGWRWNELADNPQQPVGLPQANIVTTVGSAQVNAFGASVGSHLDQWTYTYKDVATKIFGSHTIKFGGEMTALHYLQAPVGIPNYGFYNIWDFLNDAPKSEAGIFNPITGVPGGIRQDDRQYLFGFFAQDGWKARDNLIFNFGLRYSYFGSLYSKENNLSHVQFGSGPSLLTGLSVQRGGDLWTPQKGNFGPEVSAVWSPREFRDKLVVRGGYGLEFNQFEIALSSNASNNPPAATYITFDSNSATSINPNIVYATSSSPTELYGYPSNPNAITTYNAQNLPVSGHATIAAFGGISHTFPTEYIHRYSLDIQQDFGHHLIGTLGYQGNEGHHGTVHSLGNAMFAGMGVPLNPLIGESTFDFWEAKGNSNYNALVAEFKQEFAHSFTADAQFTWAKSMDQASGAYEEDAYPYNPHYAYGRSDFDIGKTFKVFGTWSPIFFRGRYGWLEKVAGGWTLSGIITFRTGYPWTPNFGTGQSLYCSNCGYYNLRPNYKGGGQTSTSNDAYKTGSEFPGYTTNGGITDETMQTAPVNGPTNNTVVAYSNKYFNVPNFAGAMTGTYPSANASLPPPPGLERNAFTGPGYRDVDMSVTKSFSFPKARVLGDNAKLDIRADIFNLFNNLNFNPTNIANNINQPNFGQAQAALGARTISFQARFNF